MGTEENADNKNVLYSIKGKYDHLNSSILSYANAFSLIMSKLLLFGKEFLINPFPNKPWFYVSVVQVFLKTLWEKEKLLVTSNFSFSHSVLYSFGELSAIFITQNCRLQTLSVWKSLKSVVCERVNRMKMLQ